MENLKFPKVYNLHNTVDSTDFEVINTKHVWKKDGDIFTAAEAAAAKTSVTHDGASSSIFVEMKSDAACYEDCSYSYGFAVRREYRRPGRLNKYPRNHMEGRPYFGTIAPVTISGGVISRANLEAMESNLLALIKADHEAFEESRFFKAFKAIYITTTGTPTAVLTIGGTASAVTAMTVAGINALTGVAAIDLGSGAFMIISTVDGQDVTIGTLTTTVVTKQGIIIVADDPKVKAPVYSADTCDLSFVTYVALTVPAVTGKKYKMNLVYTDGAVVVADVASPAALVTAALVEVRADAKGNIVYMTDGTKKLREIVILPDSASISMYPTTMLVGAGNGTYPIMDNDALTLKFQGRTRGWEGENRGELPIGKRFGLISYVKTVETPAASGGASSTVSQTTRIGVVLSFDAINSDSALKSLF